MASFKFKKGELVIVDDSGQPVEFEIISLLPTHGKLKSEIDLCYDARNVLTGKSKTISEDEILRLATPVDNSAQLFSKEK